MNFGEILKMLRESRNLTQKQMSEILGVSKSNISKYEAGTVEPNIDTLKNYASYFNVSADYLLGIRKSDSETNDCYNYFYAEGDANWRIRQIAEQKKCSYEEMLEKSCISKERLDALWFGTSQPIAEELIRIAHVLDISIDYLLDESQRERLTAEEELILRYFSRDPENILMLLDAYCSLDSKERAIILGKCLEMEREKAISEELAIKQAK